MKVEHKGYTVMQDPDNHHTAIFDKNGHMVFHAQTDKEKTVEELKEKVEPMFTYEDAIKQLVAFGKADKILSSDKAKLLSTPALTPTGDISPEWAEWLAQQKNLQKE